MKKKKYPEFCGDHTRIFLLGDKKVWKDLVDLNWRKDLIYTGQHLGMVLIYTIQVLRPYLSTKTIYLYTLGINMYR